MEAHASEPAVCDRAPHPASVIARAPVRVAAPPDRRHRPVVTAVTGAVPRGRRVLLAEDDPDARRLIAARLRAFGHKVVEAADGADVIDRLEQTIWGERADLFDVIVSDVNMPCLSGLDLLTALRCARWTTPVILVTGFDDEEIAADARALGAAAILHKPLDPSALAAAVATAARA